MEKEYPAIAARARQEKAEIHWGDETGLRSDDVKGRSYAPKGKTPVQYVKAAPEKLNMISTVTNRGLMRFMFYRETMTAQLLIRFLKRLIRSSQKKIFLILDNLLSAKLQSRPESRRITEPGFESGPFQNSGGKTEWRA